MRRKNPKWHWLFWGIMPLALLLAEATTAVDGTTVSWYKYVTPQKAAGILNHSQRESDRGGAAIVRVYPPPQPNGNLWNPGTDYFPGASAILNRRTILAGQSFSFITLVIGLFAHFYSNARNSAGLDDDPHGECLSV